VEVKYFFGTKRSDQDYLAAAKVGGIYVNNTYLVEFIYDNPMVYKNLIHQAFMSRVKPLFLRSICIYLKLAEQFITVDTLLNEKLEPTNKHYAIAKIAGLKM